MKAEQSKLPPTPLLGRKVFLDPQETSPARSQGSPLMRRILYEQAEPRAERPPQEPSPSSVARRLGSTVANYTPIMNGSSGYRSSLEARAIPMMGGVAGGVVGVAASLGTAAVEATYLGTTAAMEVRGVAAGFGTAASEARGLAAGLITPAVEAKGIAASLVTGAAAAVEVKASQYLRQPKIKHMDDMVTPMLVACRLEKVREKEVREKEAREREQRERERDIVLMEPAPVMPVMAEVVLQEMGREGMGRERLNSEPSSRDHRAGSSRSEPQQRDRDRDSRDSRDSHREARLERQHSSEALMIQARRDELPQEVWRERAERKERKLERQTSSEQEGHGHEGRRKDRHRTERQESSEHDTAKEQSDRRST